LPAEPFPLLHTNTSLYHIGYDKLGALLGEKSITIEKMYDVPVSVTLPSSLPASFGIEAQELVTLAISAHYAPPHVDSMQPISPMVGVELQKNGEALHLEDMDEPMTMTIPISTDWLCEEDRLRFSGRGRCMAWNGQTYSSDGCITTQTVADAVTCTCSHLQRVVVVEDARDLAIVSTTPVAGAGTSDTSSPAKSSPEGSHAGTAATPSPAGSSPEDLPEAHGSTAGHNGTPEQSTPAPSPAEVVVSIDGVHLASGEYSGFVTVLLTPGTGSKLAYTVDGSLPSCSNAEQRDVPKMVIMTENTNISAVSCYESGSSSVKTWEFKVAMAPYVSASIVIEGIAKLTGEMEEKLVDALSLEMGIPSALTKIVSHSDSSRHLLALIVEVHFLASSVETAQALKDRATEIDFASVIKEIHGFEGAVVQDTVLSLVQDGDLPTADSSISAPKPQPQQEEHTKMALVIGAAVGGAILLLASTTICYLHRKSKQRSAAVLKPSPLKSSPGKPHLTFGQSMSTRWDVASLQLQGAPESIEMRFAETNPMARETSTHASRYSDGERHIVRETGAPAVIEASVGMYMPPPVEASVGLLEARPSVMDMSMSEDASSCCTPALHSLSAPLAVEELVNLPAPALHEQRMAPGESGDSNQIRLTDSLPAESNTRMVSLFDADQPSLFAGANAKPGKNVFSPRLSGEEVTVSAQDHVVGTKLMGGIELGGIGMQDITAKAASMAASRATSGGLSTEDAPVMFTAGAGVARAGSEEYDDEEDSDSEGSCSSRRHSAQLDDMLAMERRQALIRSRRRSSVQAAIRFWEHKAELQKAPSTEGTSAPSTEGTACSSRRGSLVAGVRRSSLVGSHNRRGSAVRNVLLVGGVAKARRASMEASSTLWIREKPQRNEDCTAAMTGGAPTPVSVATPEQNAEANQELTGSDEGFELLDTHSNTA